MTASKKSYPRSSPVSSKYEFVMPPFLLFYDTNQLRTSSGNMIDHTIGGRWCVPFLHTLPAPSSYVYVNLMYYESPGTISYTLVGR